MLSHASEPALQRHDSQGYVESPCFQKKTQKIPEKL